MKKGYIKHQLHIIGNFNKFDAINENIAQSINLFPKMGFVPNVFIEQQLGSMVQSKRIALQSSDLDLLVEIPADRISISCFNKLDLNGNIIEKETIDIIDRFVFISEKLLGLIGIEAYRLSYITEYYNESKASDDYKKYIIPTDFFNQEELYEWSFRLNRKFKIEINGSLEKLNVISKLSKEVNHKINDSFSLNGIVYHIDINTPHENFVERFNYQSVTEFLKKALDLNSKLSEEYGIY